MNLIIDSSSKLNYELKQRREQALIVAQKCIQLLKDKFGATEVILCGSF
jgi:hypothetical protein